MQWVDTVKDLGVEFAGFSNPKLWNVERLLAKDPAVLAKAKVPTLKPRTLNPEPRISRTQFPKPLTQSPKNRAPKPETRTP